MIGSDLKLVSAFESSFNIKGQPPIQILNGFDKICFVPPEYIEGRNRGIIWTPEFEEIGQLLGGN